MFAGDGVDSESVFSVEPSIRLQRSKSAVQPSSRRHHHPNDPYFDRVEAAARTSYIEEEFGWSGSVGGIRGRDDRQIERDVEYERKMAERSRKRHARKLARQQQAKEADSLDLNSNSSSSRTAAVRRPVFAPTDKDLEQVDELTSTQFNPKPTQTSPNLNRGKSLRDKVEAALGRWNSVGVKKTTRSQSVSAIDSNQLRRLNDPPMVERKEGLGALARRISRKLTIEDQERRRRERLEMAFAEPPVLSHTLVGAASPFPMRPALSALVPSAQLEYGEAHTDYSLNPFRRRPTNADKDSRPGSSTQTPKPHNPQMVKS